MATSGTTVFEKTLYIDEVIEESFERIGMVNVSGYKMKSAHRSLNIMLQEWANRGLHYWEIGNTLINLVQGQAAYNFYRSSGDGTSSPVLNPDNSTTLYGVDDILEAAYRRNNAATNQADSALTKISRSTYNGLSAKLNQSTPSQYYVQRFSDNVVVNLYPSPDATAASNYVFMYYIKRIQDAGVYSNVADVPYRFVPCMIAGLAYYLSQKYKVEYIQNLKLIYEDELNRALTEDGSASSTYLTPQAYYPNV
tara:strand:+ start:141 stop:896 length:756 start_codon:yes stop_codon:yes gene_type:complete